MTEHRIPLPSTEQESIKFYPSDTPEARPLGMHMKGTDTTSQQYIYNTKIK